MDRQDLLKEIEEVRKLLMHLSNKSQGNSDLFDAILKAEVALYEAMDYHGG